MTIPHNYPVRQPHQPLSLTAYLWRICVSLLIVLLLFGAGAGWI